MNKAVKCRLAKNRQKNKGGEYFYSAAFIEC